MKKLAVVVLLVLGVVKLASGGGGSPEAKAHAACKNIVKQCDGLARLGGTKLTKSDVESCTADLVTGKDELDDQFAPMMSCMAEADSCGEALGCIGGAVMNGVGKELDGLDRGFRRMTK